MNQIQTVAKILTDEVMDENYRGTQRISKHGERGLPNVKKTIPNFIRALLKKYINYYGKRG